MFRAFIGELGEDMRCTDRIRGFEHLPITGWTPIVEPAESLKPLGNVPGETASNLQFVDVSPLAT